MYLHSLLTALIRSLLTVLIRRFIRALLFILHKVSTNKDHPSLLHNEMYTGIGIDIYTRLIPKLLRIIMIVQVARLIESVAQQVIILRKLLLSIKGPAGYILSVNQVGNGNIIRLVASNRVAITVLR